MSPTYRFPWKTSTSKFSMRNLINVKHFYEKLQQWNFFLLQISTTWSVCMKNFTNMNFSQWKTLPICNFSMKSQQRNAFRLKVSPTWITSMKNFSNVNHFYEKLHQHKNFNEKLHLRKVILWKFSIKIIFMKNFTNIKVSMKYVNVKFFCEKFNHCKAFLWETSTK